MIWKFLENLATFYRMIRAAVCPTQSCFSNLFNYHSYIWTGFQQNYT